MQAQSNRSFDQEPTLVVDETDEDDKEDTEQTTQDFNKLDNPIREIQSYRQVEDVYDLNNENVGHQQLVMSEGNFKVIQPNEGLISPT